MSRWRWVLSVAAVAWAYEFTLFLRVARWEYVLDGTPATPAPLRASVLQGLGLELGWVAANVALCVVLAVRSWAAWRRERAAQSPAPAAWFAAVREGEVWPPAPEVAVKGPGNSAV